MDIWKIGQFFIQFFNWTGWTYGLSIHPFLYTYFHTYIKNCKILWLDSSHLFSRIGLKVNKSCPKLFWFIQQTRLIIPFFFAHHVVGRFLSLSWCVVVCMASFYIGWSLNFSIWKINEFASGSGLEFFRQCIDFHIWIGVLGWAKNIAFGSVWIAPSYSTCWAFLFNHWGSLTY